MLPESKDGKAAALTEILNWFVASKINIMEK